MTAIDFLGETFEAEAPSAVALMDFAEIAADGTESNQMAGIVAMKTLLRDCFEPGEFDRFWATAKKQRADGEKLMAFIAALASGEAERPTQRSSDSSDGPSVTPRSSESRLAELASERWSGRPDLVLAATRTA
jgi:hypothetical protein